MVALACLMFYMAFVFLPTNYIKIYSGLFPERVIIIDPNSHSREVAAADSKTRQMYINLVMGTGAMAGVVGMAGFFWLVTMLSIWINPDRRVLIDYLKATSQRDNSGAT